jgi:hypothetical protein
MPRYEYAPRPGHVAEHETGTPRAGRTGDPAGGRPASRRAGFTWRAEGSEIFMPFSALMTRRGGYGPDVMDHVHQSLLALDARTARPGAAPLPPGAMLLVSANTERDSSGENENPERDSSGENENENENPERD